MVSRLTVREAIRSLASTQVIRVQQGRSSIINPVEQWSALDPRLLRARGRASGSHSAYPSACSRPGVSSRWPSPRWLPNGAPRITCSAPGGRDRLDAGGTRPWRRSRVRRGRPRVPQGALRGRRQRVPRGPDAAARLGDPRPARGDVVGRRRRASTPSTSMAGSCAGLPTATPGEPGRRCVNLTLTEQYMERFRVGAARSRRVVRRPCPRVQFDGTRPPHRVQEVDRPTGRPVC